MNEIIIIRGDVSNKINIILTLAGVVFKFKHV